MADAKISALTELTGLSGDDEFVAVDKSDPTMAPSGTDKRVTKATLALDLTPTAPAAPVSGSDTTPYGEHDLPVLSPNGWANAGDGSVEVRGDPALLGSAAYPLRLRVETTSGTDAPLLVSLPFAVDRQNRYALQVVSKRLSGAIAMRAVVQGYEAGSDSATGSVTLWTGYDPGTGGDTKVATFGRGRSDASFLYSANALPANTDRVAIRLYPTEGTTGVLEITSVKIVDEDRCVGRAVGGGTHEAVYDGEHVYASAFQNGALSKFTTDGVATARANAVSGGTFDPHQVICEGAHIYSACFAGQNLTKHAKTVTSDNFGGLIDGVAKIALASNAYGLVSDGAYIYVTLENGHVKKVRLSDFTEVADYNVGFIPSSTQATPLLVDDSLWVHSASDGKVFRVDPDDGTVLATIAAPTGFTSTRNYGFGTDGEHLYLGFANGYLVEYDPATNAEVDRYELGVYVGGQIKYDGYYLWMPAGSVAQSYCVLRFDPVEKTWAIIHRSRAHGSKWVEIVEGEVWVGGLLDNRIERIVRPALRG